MSRTITDEEAQEFIDLRKTLCIPGTTEIAYPIAPRLDPAKVKAWLQKRTDEEGGGAFSFLPEELEPLVKGAWVEAIDAKIDTLKQHMEDIYGVKVSP